MVVLSVKHVDTMKFLNAVFNKCVSWISNERIQLTKMQVVTIALAVYLLKQQSRVCFQNSGFCSSADVRLLSLSSSPGNEQPE